MQIEDRRAVLEDVRHHIQDPALHVYDTGAQDADLIGNVAIRSVQQQRGDGTPQVDLPQCRDSRHGVGIEPAIDNPVTTSGCEYTWPSTGKTPSLPKADAFTVAGESWVSCKFELVRSLSPLAVSMLTAAWLSREHSTVADMSLTHCMESLHRFRVADIGSYI